MVFNFGCAGLNDLTYEKTTTPQGETKEKLVDKSKNFNKFGPPGPRNLNISSHSSSVPQGVVGQPGYYNQQPVAVPSGGYYYGGYQGGYHGGNGALFNSNPGYSYYR